MELWRSHEPANPDVRFVTPRQRAGSCSPPVAEAKGGGVLEGSKPDNPDVRLATPPPRPRAGSGRTKQRDQIVRAEVPGSLDLVFDPSALGLMTKRIPNCPRIRPEVGDACLLIGSRV